MTLDPQLLDLMPHTVTLTAPTGVNAQGKPTYVGGIPKSYRARVVGMAMAIRNREHDDRERLFQAYVDIGSDLVTANYRLQLPADLAWDDGSGKVDPMIFTVLRETDEDGHHHVKLSCGFMYHRQGGS